MRHDRRQRVSRKAAGRRVSGNNDFLIAVGVDSAAKIRKIGETDYWSRSN